MMRVVVLGATGAVGRHVVLLALDAGYEVVAYSRNAAKLRVSHHGLQLVEGHLSDMDKLEKAMHGADAVVSAKGFFQWPFLQFLLTKSSRAA